MTRKLLVAGVALAVAAGSLEMPAAATTTVSVGDNYFVRPTGVPTVTVAHGSRVAFHWIGHNLHNAHGVRVNTGVVCNRTRTAGGCVTPLLNTPGTYTIYCQIHGAADMHMRLHVT
jgi:plastocyanin